jgi:hypothetical protein
MNSKRKFSDFSVESSGAGETEEYIPSHENHKHKRNKGAAKVKPTSLNWTKKRARTIERRLKREDSLPAGVKIELERELDHHKQKIDELADEKMRSKMIQRYHMVRFFGEHFHTNCDHY